MDRGDIDQLWTLPLEDFTKVRDELAKRAKDQGDAESAKDLKSLRKPTVAAWAVNQLARRRGDDIRRLLGLGEVMRKAQQEAFEGGGREALRTATAERRRVIDQLVEDAEALLTQAGHGSSRAVLDKVANTLTATATDQEAARLVGDGALQREAALGSGLDDMAAWLPSGTAPARASSRRSKPAPRSPSGRTKRTEDLARRREAAAVEAEAEAGRLRSEADRLAREADKAERGARRAEQQAAQARERADQARQEADAAERDDQD